MSNPEIDALVDEWGEDNVRKAFWLQSKIERDGLDAIRFMRKGEKKANKMKGLVTSNTLRSELKKRY